jgi:hypothetical protein
MTSDKRRVPYDPTRASLYRPGDADDFFTRPGDWSHAALCAELSRLSYCNDADRRTRSLARVGLREQEFLNVEGTKALIAMDAARVFIAFRGTDDPKALLKDLDALPVSWEQGGRVHKGFVRHLRPVRDALTRIVAAAAGRELFFTGHSLGAAAATLSESLSPRATLYTFGSPRVGDSAFASTLPADRVQRFVHCCDLVCRVPPERLRHVHVGALRYIDRNGLLSAQLAADEIVADQRAGRRAYRLRHARALRKNVSLRDLADHAPVNYIAAV